MLQLEGGQTFERILAYRKEQERLLQAIHLPYEPSSTGADAIMREICLYRNVLPKEIKSKSRMSRIVWARQEICYWMRRKTKLTTSQIAKKVKYYDHTVVIWSCRVYATRHDLPSVLRVDMK